MQVEKTFAITAGETTDLTIVAGTGKVNVSVTGKKGGKPIKEGSRYWQIFPLDAKGHPGERIDSSYDNPTWFALPAGSYLARVETGKARIEKTFAIVSGETTDLTLVAGTGKVHVSVTGKEGGEPIRHGSRYWQIFRLDSAGQLGERIDSSYDNPTWFALPAGSYMARVETGNTQVEKSFVVAAGEAVEMTLVSNTGRVNVSVTAKEGGKPIRKGSRYWEIFTVDAAGKSGEKIDSSYNNPAWFALPAGSYLARVETGKTQVEKSFAIFAGETAELTLVSNTGSVAVSVSGVKGGKPLKQGNRYWEIFTLDATGKPEEKIDSSYNNPAWFALPAGSYLARVTVAERVIEESFTIKPGDVAELQLVMPGLQ